MGRQVTGSAVRTACDGEADIVVTKFAGALGAKVSGVSLHGGLPQETIGAILAALYEHKVLFFEDQRHFNDDVHRAFVGRLGPPYENPSLPDDIVAKSGGMYELDGSRPDGRAESWHTDSTFSPEPPSISVLRGVTIPEWGGDTCWANCIRAYNTLTPPLKQLAETLRVFHSNKFDLTAMRPNATTEELEFFNKVTTAKTMSAEHPLVHVHPVTGERSLLLGKYGQRIVGQTARESDLIKALFQEHIVQTANTVRWNWSVHDVVMWDNFATQHCVVNDWADQPRVVRRWTVAGQPLISVDGRVSIELR